MSHKRQFTHHLSAYSRKSCHGHIELQFSVPFFNSFHTGISTLVYIGNNVAFLKLLILRTGLVLGLMTYFCASTWRQSVPGCFFSLFW